MNPACKQEYIQHFVKKEKHIALFSFEVVITLNCTTFVL